MMVEKESGVLREPEFPSVWVDETETNPARLRYVMALRIRRCAHTLPRYFNTITGTRICRKPKPCLGGLLADVGCSSSPSVLGQASHRLHCGRTWVWVRR